MSSRLMLCAPSSGGGKTTVTCALLQALVNRGLDVGAFLRLAQAIRFETEGRAQETVALLDEPGLGREE